MRLSSIERIGDLTDMESFDMGGTSTDVSHFDGKLEHTFENVIAGVTVMAPQLDINTVAAGGGSILNWKNGYQGFQLDIQTRSRR